MGNITQIDKNIPKLSTKQFDRTFRRRNLTNECVAYVDKSCKIFRVTDFVLEVIPFQKNKLLYYPIEHICPETQQILNLKTKTALNVIGIQACNNTEGTLDIIWSFRRPNLPTLGLSKSFILPNIEKKQSTTKNKTKKEKNKKSKKKVKTKQKTPKLDGEFEIENCKYVEEQKETDEEEKNQETDKQQEKEKQEITKESETNENKKEKKTETKEEEKQNKKKKEIKTGKKIKKKRIKKKINKNTNKKRGLDDFDLESNKKIVKNKLIWTIVGVTPFNLDGKIIFQAKVKKIKKPKDLLRMRGIITKKQMQVNDLQKEVNELIRQNENKEEKKQLYTIQQESERLIESSTNIRKLKKKLELEILDLEEKIELREKEKLKMQVKENEEVNGNENENTNEREKETEEESHNEREKKLEKEKEKEKEKEREREKENEKAKEKEEEKNIMKKKMSFRNFYFESKSKIELPTEPENKKSFQEMEVERYLNSIKKKKLK
ncbi:transmembrane protein [Anaeramoeba flamelloides]|uniref:Transmembrane protein n=1 Tax=Anaeramoeba flamelloides TaxID=1746091 RepID=A0ABQ8XKK0_9EUKA|nr:transmembrane protein [Anaeramoeba flamelloides]